MLQDNVTNYGAHTLPAAALGVERSCQPDCLFIQRSSLLHQDQQLLHERTDSLYFLSTALEGELVAAQGNINVQKLLEHTEVRIMLSHEHLSYVVIQRQYLLRHAGLPTFPATQCARPAHTTKQRPSGQ